MKIHKLFTLGIVLLFACSMQAQVSVSISLGSPPLWGPVGYKGVQYYYIPDVESYYDIQASRFIYLEGGKWVHRTSLPLRYRSYDLYRGYKVVMNDYHGNTPYIHYKDHKQKYARGYHGQPQQNIGEKPGKGNSKAGYSVKAKSGNKHGEGKGKKK